MKLTLAISRCARRGGSIGVGIRYLMPLSTIVGVGVMANISQLQFDLLLWQVRLTFTGGAFNHDLNER